MNGPNLNKAERMQQQHFELLRELEERLEQRGIFYQEMRMKQLQLHLELLKEVRKRKIDRRAYSMKHAILCYDEHCELQGCARMRRQHQHLIIHGNAPNCTRCSRVVRVFHDHAMLCKVAACDVPSCEIMKHEMRVVNQWANHRGQAECPFTADGG